MDEICPACQCIYQEAWERHHRSDDKRTTNSLCHCPVQGHCQVSSFLLHWFLMLMKGVCRLPKQKGVTRCGRLISAAGFGPDATNWNQALKLRKERKIKAWMEGLEDPDGSDGLEAYEEDRVKALELLNQLGSGDKKDAWLAVDAIADKYSKPLPAQQ